MRSPFVFRSSFILAVLFLLSMACSRSIQTKIEVDPAFGAYISAYTSGIVSGQSSVIVKLANDYENSIDPQQSDVRPLFRFTPELSGKTYWLDARTVEFRPDVPMPLNTAYKVDFALGKLMEVEKKFEVFSFGFKTREQTLTLFFDGLSTYDLSNLSRQKIEGYALLAEPGDTALLAKSVRAIQNGKDLHMRWQRESDEKHRFVIENITRGEKQSTVKISWTGMLLGASDKGERHVEVPALGDFKVTNVLVNQQPEQYLIIHYSDPLLANQSFNGLVALTDTEYGSHTPQLSFVAEGHKLIAYPSRRQVGVKQVHIFRGVRNVMGYACPDEKSVEVEFEELKPDVRLLGQGVIIPTSEKGMLFPFEAVNLKAVDVSVMRIYENNILQFLQVNTMSGTSQLKRVGRDLIKKRIDLDPEGKLNLHDWNRFSIDLSALVAPEPGALYHVELKFKREYSVYRCGGTAPDEASMTYLEPVEQGKEWTEKGWGSSYGDYYYEYDDYYYDYDDYDYRQRDNPCHNTYYYGKGFSHNVLISDIGIIAKAGGDKVMNVYVSDIRNTSPIRNCTLEFYDFQRQLIGKASTDNTGFASLRLETKPFAVIAKHGNQRGYLRLRDGESLSMSKFDVEGETVQNGVKGFIYAERGVWRPGDSLYLSFMLEDKENLLPASHPVTMELLNPQGVSVQKIVRTKHVNGLYDFRTATRAEAPTGYYTAKVNVGNREFTKTLRVETVKPNRLKLYLDFGREKLTSRDIDKPVKLEAKWLHGAVARNLKARVEVSVSQIPTTFSGYKGFSFDDPTRTFHSEEQIVFEGTLDEEGRTQFDPRIHTGDAAPGMLRASFTTRVFEESGDFSIDRSSITYLPYAAFVGIKVPEGDQYNGTLVTDKDHTVEIATVDADGKPLSRRNLEVKVYQIRWRWWWDHYNEDLSSYIANYGVTPLLDTRVNTQAGKGKFTLRVNRPSWGRYLVYVKDHESGHATGQVVYIDWPSWARANRKDNENASMLSFSTDKEKYAPGEKVKLSFPSSSKGRALVTVESGVRVLQHFWVETTEGETHFEFNATADMAPNAYINVTLLQPHEATANDLPLRLFGVLPIRVENPDSHLEPIISMPEVIRPETTTRITVRETKGKPMTYTLAMVDEGLLDLTAFKTPDPWNHFNAREALGVKTWDVYDIVMGSFAARIDKMLAIGGDGEAAGKKGAKANRFKPMVYFAGPFSLKAGASATHQVEIPNYVGSVRVMVVAGENERYGHASKTVAVRNPLMVLGTLPRVLGPGETVQLPVNVFAMENHVKDVTIEIQPNEFLKPKNGTRQKLHFSKPGDEVVNFELEVAEKLGVGKVKILVSSGNEKARHEIEIDVRAPNPPVADVVETVLEPGKSWTPSVTLQGMPGTNKLRIELSSIPPVNLGERLKYLITYPHGCLEQTTSGAFPQLFLSGIMELDASFKREISDNINAALRRIELFQTPEGGFSYWPGETDNSEWATNYAGHFMLEAEAKGYRLQSALRAGWIKYQQKMARNWRSGQRSGAYGAHYDDLTQAYRLYTLALAKAPETGAMNRLRESANLSVAARWRLAGAYQLAGHGEVAAKLIEGASTKVPKYTELSYTFGNDVRDKAMILEVLSLMKQQAKAQALMKDIAAELNSDTWMSTQTTAYCLIAMSKFVGSSPIDKQMKFRYGLQGGQEVAHTTQVPVFRREIDASKLRNNARFVLKNEGAGIMYAKLVSEGIPVVGDQSSAADHIRLSVSYHTPSGHPLDVTELEQGTDFIAEVVLTNPGTRGYLAEMILAQIFPSGWEIHNPRMDDQAAPWQGDFPTYQDIRDDRVYTYFNVAANTSKTFRIRLSAAYLGHFYLPTVSVEAMYDNSIHARTPGKWVKVVKPASGMAAGD